ncbi:hypothetical protein BGM09_01030 [Streptomyces sp. CBMA29]|nr:hypothetical protein [Streptomyces sp. CBMA29]
MVTLIQDLEEYADRDRIFQGERGPNNPLNNFLVWCLSCAIAMDEAGDGIVSFREFGWEQSPDEGPYSRYLAGKQTVKKPPP